MNGGQLTAGVLLAAGLVLAPTLVAQADSGALGTVLVASVPAPTVEVVEAPADLTVRAAVAPCAGMADRFGDALRRAGRGDLLAGDEAAGLARLLMDDCGWGEGRVLAEAEEAT